MELQDSTIKDVNLEDSYPNNIFVDQLGFNDTSAMSDVTESNNLDEEIQARIRHNVMMRRSFSADGSKRKAAPRVRSYQERGSLPLQTLFEDPNINDNTSESKFKETPLIHSVALIEFDMEIGAFISQVYPEETRYSNFEQDILACAFPDGCHEFNEEWSFILIKKSSLDEKNDIMDELPSLSSSDSQYTNSVIQTPTKPPTAVISKSETISPQTLNLANTYHYIHGKQDISSHNSTTTDEWYREPRGSTHSFDIPSSRNSMVVQDSSVKKLPAEVQMFIEAEEDSPQPSRRVSRQIQPIDLKSQIHTVEYQQKPQEEKEIKTVVSNTVEIPSPLPPPEPEKKQKIGTLSTLKKKMKIGGDIDQQDEKNWKPVTEKEKKLTLRSLRRLLSDNSPPPERQDDDSIEKSPKRTLKAIKKFLNPDEPSSLDNEITEKKPPDSPKIDGKGSVKKKWGTLKRIRKKLWKDNEEDLGGDTQSATPDEQEQQRTDTPTEDIDKPTETPEPSNRSSVSYAESHTPDLASDDNFQLDIRPRLLKLSEMENEEYLYGICYYQNIKDATAKRGNVLKSLFLLSNQPFFQLFVKMLREAMYRCMSSLDETESLESSKEDKYRKILRMVYESINESFVNKAKYSLRNITTLKLFDKTFTTNLFLYFRKGNDEFPDASLLDLVKTFRTRTLLFWYAAILGKRILFYSKAAHQAAEFCLAIPLLVAPLHGFINVMAPYVSMRNKDKLKQPFFVCGTSNRLFADRKEIYDVGGVFIDDEFKVINHKEEIDLTLRDKEFMRNILQGIENGESETWVRSKFRERTKRLLKRIEEGSSRKMFDKVKESTMFASYMEKKQQMIESNVNTFLRKNSVGDQNDTENSSESSKKTISRTISRKQSVGFALSMDKFFQFNNQDNDIYTTDLEDPLQEKRVASTKELTEKLVRRTLSIAMPIMGYVPARKLPEINTNTQSKKSPSILAKFATLRGSKSKSNGSSSVGTPQKRLSLS